MWRMTWHIEPQWKLPEYTWGDEKKTCKQCKHYIEGMTGRAYMQTTTMRCAVNSSRRSNMTCGTCIDMRYDGPCGRNAMLFEPK